MSHGPKLGGPGGRRLPTRQLEIQEPDLTPPSPGNDSDDLLTLPQRGREASVKSNSFQFYMTYRLLGMLFEDAERSCGLILAAVPKGQGINVLSIAIHICCH